MSSIKKSQESVSAKNKKAKNVCFALSILIYCLFIFIALLML